METLMHDNIHKDIGKYRSRIAELEEQCNRLASSISVALAEAYLLQANNEWPGFENIRVILQNAINPLNKPVGPENIKFKEWEVL